MEGRVSEKLHTLPSVNPTLALTCYQLTFIGLGAREVRNCSDNNADSQFLLHIRTWDPKKGSSQF